MRGLGRYGRFKENQLLQNRNLDSVPSVLPYLAKYWSNISIFQYFNICHICVVYFNISIFQYFAPRLPCHNTAQVEKNGQVYFVESLCSQKRVCYLLSIKRQESISGHDTLFFSVEPRPSSWTKQTSQPRWPRHCRFHDSNNRHHAQQQ